MVQPDKRVQIMIDMLSQFDQEKMRYKNTLQSVGDVFGITRERVRQITGKAGFFRKTIRQRRLEAAPECKSAGCKERMGWLQQESSYAEWCHEHRFARKTVSLTCSWSGCGIEFIRPVYSHRPNYNRGKTGTGISGRRYSVPVTEQKEFFCTKSHQGKWLAESHGFPAHPENAGRKKHNKGAKAQTMKKRAYYLKHLNKWLDKIAALDREGEKE